MASLRPLLLIPSIKPSIDWSRRAVRFEVRLIYFTGCIFRTKALP